ncbi:MAG TPA: GntR family transcriptional regulator [Chloroflexota bacterium]|jgi:DNA-binding GntR family transcriptional regulator|nr:GntR family transcriptional regulator [Chloroflexota bacterium]
MVRPLAGRPTTAERMVHTILQQRILDGVLRPGERIDLDAIASELAVSRTPVRTALRQLESEGLVTIYPHRAVMVSELSADDLDQIYAVRIHLETFAAQLAVPNLRDEDLAELRRIHEEMGQVIEDGNLAAFAEKDRAFHLALYRAANNRFLSRLIDDLRKASLRFLTVYASVERLPSAIAEHEEIIAAAERRDAEQVAQLIQKNLQRTCNVASAFLRARSTSSSG